MNFELQHFHEYHELFQQNTIFSSVSSNFLEFRMFWHVPFQELQVSKRHRHFEQNFQLSQHLFPVPFVASLWVSLADCASASPMKAVSLAPRMRPSLGCLAASKQHPNNMHIQHPNPKKTPPTVKSNYFRVACSAFTLEILVFQAEFWVIFSRSVHCCFRGFDEVWSPDFRSTKAQEWDDSIPKMACSTMNHMVISVISHSWAIPMFGGPIIPPSFYMGWIPIWFGEFQVLMGENQKLNSSTQFLVGCIILYSLCPNLMVLLLLFANSIVYITTC